MLIKLLGYCRFENEVRVRSVPLMPCRRKKRKFEELDGVKVKLEPTTAEQSPAFDPFSRPSSTTSDSSHGFDGMDSQLQSSHVSSTVFDSPHSLWRCSPDTLVNRSPVCPWFPPVHGSRDWPKITSSEGMRLKTKQGSNQLLLAGFL